MIKRLDFDEEKISNRKEYHIILELANKIDELIYITNKLVEHHPKLVDELKSIRAEYNKKLSESDWFK